MPPAPQLAAALHHGVESSAVRDESDREDSDMFIRNTTDSYQSFRLNDSPISMKPHGTTMITDEQAKDDVFQLLLSRGVVEKCDMEDAKEEPKPEPKPRKQVEVKRQDEQQKDSAVVVKCAATLKNGNPCGGTINVQLAEYDEETPYFCKRHKAEQPRDYEKHEGAWVKKTSAAKKPRTKQELVDKAADTMTNSELEKAIESAEESPEKPKINKRTTTTRKRAKDAENERLADERRAEVAE